MRREPMNEKKTLNRLEFKCGFSSLKSLDCIEFVIILSFKELNRLKFEVLVLNVLEWEDFGMNERWYCVQSETCAKNHDKHQSKRYISIAADDLLEFQEIGRCWIVRILK